MSDDIGRLLKHWKYLPNDVNVRIIDGQDGGKKLQMRIDLGLLQMELDGRPDGRRPHHFDSYLSYFEDRAKTALQGGGASFSLSTVDCLRLQQEAIQFYHRYIALLRLGDYQRVVRDTRRNLKVFDLVHKYAKSQEIIWTFEQYRPYVLMMYVRAAASLAMDTGGVDESIRLIEKGIRAIERHYQKYRKHLGKEMVEVELLREWLDELREQKPLSERERLLRLMDRAVQEEAYEVAAGLRDRLRQLDQK